MSADPNGFMPPTPRDRDVPTLSEIIPFRSKKISIRRSKVLAPLMLLALMVVLFYILKDEGRNGYFIIALVWLAVVGVFLAIYAYSGTRKRWWWYAAPALLTWWLLRYQLDSYIFVFREVLPGNTDGLPNDAGFIQTFVTFFFAAGLCEELLKATPALLALLVTLAVRRRNPALLAVGGPKTWKTRLIGGIALRGPLDGLLMGVAAGAAFILFETLGQYIVNEISRVESRTHDQNLAVLAGLELAIPRALQGISGHMGWAGIFGYFIGLSARYPRRALALLPIGYLLAAVLHGLWDSVEVLPTGEYGLIPVSIATVLLFVACLLKAKQLELAWHGADATAQSILVGAPAASAGGGVLSGLRGLASGIEAVGGQPIRPEAAPAARFSIGTDRDRYALEAGHAIDFGTLFGAPTGAAGEIDPHPSEPEALGLKNTGASPWVSTTPKGATLTVPQGRSLRIVEGTRIAFGTLVLDIRPY